MSPLAFRRLALGSQAGFSLVEVIVATVLISTVVIGSLGVLSQLSRPSARAQEHVTLLQLVRAQIEAIQRSPYKGNPEEYPKIPNIPEGFTVTWTSSSPGITYTYPTPVATTLAGEIQKITVTAQGDVTQMSITFFKARTP